MNFVIPLLFGLSISATGSEVVNKMLATDPFGLSEAEVSIRMSLTDKGGATTQMVFTSVSRRYDPPLSKSLVRFIEPTDLAGTSFLQIQRRDGDDERQLYLPDMKKTRRIAGSARDNAFMGTDFSYADLDNRDIRDGAAQIKEETMLGKTPVFAIEVIPKGPDNVYSKIELWVHRENFYLLKQVAYDKSGAVWKTLEVNELAKISGRLFAKRATMTDKKLNHSTQIRIEKVNLRSAPDGDFTTRNLEKL